MATLEPSARGDDARPVREDALAAEARRKRVKQHVHRCPSCQSREVERTARRGILERVFLLLVGQRPYRCLNCHRRFYDRRA